MQTHTRDDRSLGELFGELSRETTTLLRQEVNLAKVELSQKAVAAGKDVAFLAVGGAVLYAGLLAFIAACIIALNLIVHLWWLSAAIIAAVVLIIGYVLVMQGISHLRSGDLAPRQTAQSLKQDAQWAKEQTR
jgi:hypothetical protein